jgi:hypothetical protein
VANETNIPTKTLQFYSNRTRRNQSRENFYVGRSGGKMETNKSCVEFCLKTKPVDNGKKKKASI